MKRPLSRAEKRLIFGVPLAALLFICLASLRNGSGAIPPRPPAPKPNGFDLYVAAANALTRSNPPVDPLNDTKKRSPAEIAKFYTPTRRAAFVAQNAKTWDLMRQARAAQTLHPDVRANFGVNFPHGPLRDLARGKTIEAKHFKGLKRWDLALQSGLDTIEMGRDIEQGAEMIGSLVGIAVEHVGAASLEDVLPHLNAGDAKNGARRLEKIIAAGALPAEVLTENKWMLLTFAKNNFGQKPNRMMSIVYFRTPVTIRTTMDAYIAESKKPFALQTYSPPNKSFFNLFAELLASSPKRYIVNTARRETTENNLLLRLALRAYRVENGTYPDNLSQLAPRYLSKIPRDPFGRGETLRYRKVGDSYLLWSIGPDGKDNGGTSIPIKPGKKRVVVEEKSVGDIAVKP